MGTYLMVTPWGVAEDVGSFPDNRERGKCSKVGPLSVRVSFFMTPCRALD